MKGQGSAAPLLFHAFDRNKHVECDWNPRALRFLGFHKIAQLIVLQALSVAPPLAAANVFPSPCRKETLPNGLTVVMIPMPSPGLVSYYTVVRTGSRDEVEP